MINAFKGFLHRLRGNLKRNSSKTISSSAFIARGVQILGVDNVEIGDHCTIGENTLITINDRSHQYIALKIGENSYIGRNNFFTVGKMISIGPYSVTGNDCSFLCSDHIPNPNMPYMSTGATTEKTIRLGANVWLGFRVSIIGNVSIGHGSVVGANSVVVKDIPPFSIAVGNPARVIKRFNFETGKWENGQDLQSTKFRDEFDYIAHLKNTGWKMPPAAYSASSAYGDL